MTKPYKRRQILMGAGAGLIEMLLAACGEARTGPAPVSLVEAVRQNTPATRQETTNNIKITAKCGGELTFNFPDDEVYGVYGWEEGGACPDNRRCYFQEPNVEGSFRKTGLPAGIMIHYRIDKAGQPPETVEGSIKIPGC